MNIAYEIRIAEFFRSDCSGKGDSDGEGITENGGGNKFALTVPLQMIVF